MSQPAGPPKRLWQRMTLARWRKTGVVAVLAVTAAFGGLQDADHVTPVALDSSYDTGGIVFTAHAVEVTSTLPWIRSTLTADCRFVVLDATVENTADAAAPFPTATPIVGQPDDCATPDEPTATDAVVLANVPNNFAGALRVRDNQTVPLTEPGFTEEIQLAWVVSSSDLDRVAELSFRFRNMSQGYSTFRISRQWLADEDRYGELTLPNPVAA
ncbi:hypothetical protein [Mycolicibacterium sp.]|uniref:hypothetical protein n=1 Tax=Mycolicibacterium sp. TaxID=2320850 RepID=UPI00356056ED